MDILKKLPQEIENKVFYMVAEHPVARVFKNAILVKKAYYRGEQVLFFWRDNDDLFKNTYLNEDKIVSSILENNIKHKNIGRFI
jgi:hypothetical protein